MQTHNTNTHAHVHARTGSQVALYTGTTARPKPQDIHVTHSTGAVSQTSSGRIGLAPFVPVGDTDAVAGRRHGHGRARIRAHAAGAAVSSDGKA